MKYKPSELLKLYKVGISSSGSKTFQANSKVLEIIKDDENGQNTQDLLATAWVLGLKIGRNEPGMFAIIPMSVLENNKISPNAKLLYAEIVGLSKKSGKCFAGNSYLAEKLSLKGKSITQLLKELKDNKLIKVTIFKDKQGTRRDIITCYLKQGGYLK